MAAEQWGTSNRCFHEKASGFLPHEDKLKGCSHGTQVLLTPRVEHELSRGYSAAGTCFLFCPFDLGFPYISHLPSLHWFLTHHKMPLQSSHASGPLPISVPH